MTQTIDDGNAPQKKGTVVKLKPKIEKNDLGEDCHVFPDDAPEVCPVHFDGTHYVFDVPPDEPSATEG